VPAAKHFLQGLVKIKCAYFLSVEFEIEGQRRTGLDHGNQNNLDLNDLVANLQL
jgi:hypothetical protein